MEETLNRMSAGKTIFWRPLRPGEVVHELVDVFAEPPGPAFDVLAAKIGSPPVQAAHREAPSTPVPGIPTDDHRALTDETCRIISATVERITREMLPAIAERVIRQEIEKLKNEIG